MQAITGAPSAAPSQERALAWKRREIVEADENRAEFPVEAGRRTYVDSRQIAHGRTGFPDHGARRFWNGDEGAPDSAGGRAGR